MVEDVSDLLGEQVGDFDADMRLICREGPLGVVLVDVG